MKFADIAKRAKATKIACVLEDTNGEQWVSTGSATYKLEGLPKMDSDDFLRLAGVSEDKIGSYYRGGEYTDADAIAAMLHNETEGEIELTSDMAGITIYMEGLRLMPFYTMLNGVIWLDVKNMEPIMKGETKYLRFSLRQYGRGWQIAVKDGLVLIALISEFEMTEYLYNQVKTLWKQCEQRGITRETEEGGSGMKYEVCENCGAHLDHGEKCDCQNEE